MAIKSYISFQPNYMEDHILYADCGSHLQYMYRCIYINSTHYCTSGTVQGVCFMSTAFIRFLQNVHSTHILVSSIFKRTSNLRLEATCHPFIPASLSLSLSLHLWPSKLTGPINKGMSNRHSNRTGIASTKRNLILHLNEKSRSQEARPTFFFFFFQWKCCFKVMKINALIACVYMWRLSHILLFKILKF